MTVIDYRLVDVFAAQPLSGNGLTIFQMDRPLSDALLLGITREMRQFESIFLWRTNDARTWRARIFTMEEELGFAGHPIIGAACALHAEHFAADEQAHLLFQLPEKTVSVISRRSGSSYTAEMDQGRAAFQHLIERDHHQELCAVLNLSTSDLMEGLPLEVVSTGLPYLIVPVRQNLENARIAIRGFEALLAQFGAKFAYVLDVPTREGRTWDNDGRVEDIATGSAAGPAAAFLAKHGLIPQDQPVVIHQGRFLDRPSELTVVVSTGDGISVRVSGGVILVGRGSIDLPDSMLGG